jgi:hypothetical protein
MPRSWLNGWSVREPSRFTQHKSRHSRVDSTSDNPILCRLGGGLAAGRHLWPYERNVGSASRTGQDFWLPPCAQASRGRIGASEPFGTKNKPLAEPRRQSRRGAFAAENSVRYVVHEAGHADHACSDQFRRHILTACGNNTKRGLGGIEFADDKTRVKVTFLVQFHGGGTGF